MDNRPVSNQIEEQARKMYGEMSGVKKLFEEQPSAEDITACDGWLRRMHGQYLYISGVNARAQGLFAQAVANIIDFTPEEEFKKVKNSSTLTEHYAAAQFPNTKKVLEASHHLLVLMRMTSENYRTLMASVREEKKMSPRSTT